SGHVRGQTPTCPGTDPDMSRRDMSGGCRPDLAGADLVHVRATAGREHGDPHEVVARLGTLEVERRPLPDRLRARVGLEAGVWRVARLDLGGEAGRVRLERDPRDDFRRVRVEHDSDAALAE